jgi:hypothetical protein
MSVLQRSREVASEKYRVKDLGKEGYRPLGKLLQDPVRYTITTRSLADIETPGDVLNLVRVGQLGFAGRTHKVRPQHHINHLNKCWGRRISHRLKLSLQTVGEGFGFL